MGKNKWWSRWTKADSGIALFERLWWLVWGGGGAVVTGLAAAVLWALNWVEVFWPPLVVSGSLGALFGLLFGSMVQRRLSPLSERLRALEAATSPELPPRNASPVEEDTPEGSAAGISDLEAGIAELSAPAPSPGPKPVMIAFDHTPMPRIQIRNEGERGTFSAQCKIVDGNTGEKREPVQVSWEFPNNGSSIDLAGSHEAWLRIERPQIAREIAFSNVELSRGILHSSTGGEMPFPDNPWIEFEVNISTEGTRWIGRFLWCSCCDFRHLGSFKP